jgi:PKD repeat protein/predicted transcriptional regulator
MKRSWGPAGLALVSALLVLPGLLWSPASAQGRANLPPVAIISDPPDNAVFWVNETIYFDGRNSYDPDGNITDWKWIFLGYGYEFNLSQIGVDWSFNHPGYFVAALLVIDDDGAQSVASINVIITAPENPVANIAYPPPGTYLPFNRTVQFSSHGSLDMTGENLSFRWDFGDGTNSTEPNPAHLYSMPGGYQVQLWVRNESGAEGHMSMGFLVNDGSRSGPVAIISSPANGSALPLGDMIRFWSNGSYAPDGRPLSFLWRFGDEGPTLLFEDPGNVTFPLKEPGFFNVTLFVFNSIGETGVDRIQIYVDPNRPPVAVIEAPRHSELPTGFGALLDANGSYDPDGDSLTYDWWFNGSMGSGGSRHLSGSQAILELTDAGSYRLTLVVTDGRGKSASATMPLVVRDMDRILAWPVNGSTFETGAWVNFTGLEAFEPIDHPPLTFHWSFGDGATAEGQAVQHAYSRAGNYTFTIRAWRDNETFERRGWLLITGGARPVEILVNGLNETHNMFRTNSSLELSLQGDLWPSQAGVIHHWDLGDGTSSEGPSVEHVYALPGDYDVSVTESFGNQSITLHRIISVRWTTTIRVGPSIPVWVQYVLISASVMAMAGVAIFLGTTEIGIFALFSFLVFLYSRIRGEEILDNFTRGQIKGYITANPGDHYNSIKQALDLNNGTLAYHLQRLENERIIKSRADGIYKRFYPYEMRVPEPDGKALTEMQKLILDRVAETPGIPQKDVAGFLHVSGGTINYHMETLIKMGRVVRKRDGMKVRYYPVETSFTDVVEGIAK